MMFQPFGGGRKSELRGVNVRITDQLVLVIKVASWSKFFPEKQGLAQKTVRQFPMSVPSVNRHHGVLVTRESC
jgi:hypothetical protein